MINETGMDVLEVLGVPIAVSTMGGAVRQVNRWIAESTRPRLVTFTNVHMLVEANLNPDFMQTIRHMDLNCPDGFPVFWLTRQKRGPAVEKIAGPEFMPLFCQQSVALGHRHFLYGGGPGVAQTAAKKLQATYPGINICGVCDPPFRQLNSQELDEMSAVINNSQADVVWVCLGCPKQEQWLDTMRHRLNAKVVLAVGQAFDILAGKTQRSPAILTRFGMEWLYRLLQEPRRLWKRYLVTNLMFCLFLARYALTGPRGAASVDRARNLQ